MTHGDKDLVLKDLCSRLPYGVKCYVKVEDGYWNGVTIDGIHPHNKIFTNVICEEEKILQSIEYIELKPYLFPISSMTEEQKEEYDYECNEDLKALSHSVANRTYAKTRIATPLYYGIDWLNKNHFDYRGLIEKGLAIDATGLNIY